MENTKTIYQNLFEAKKHIGKSVKIQRILSLKASTLISMDY